MGRRDAARLATLGRFHGFRCALSRFISHARGRNGIRATDIVLHHLDALHFIADGIGAAVPVHVLVGIPSTS